MSTNKKDFIGPFSFYNHKVMGEGFVLDWLKCGLFEAPMEREYDAIPPEGKDTLLSVGGEKRVVPFEGLRVKWEGKELEWKKWHGDDIVKSIFYDQWTKEWFPKWGYAVTYIESPSQREVLLWVRGNNLQAIWVNHRLLSEASNMRLHKVCLQRGLNIILIRVEQERGIPSFTFRITDEGEKGIPDINIWLMVRRPIKGIYCPADAQKIKRRILTREVNARYHSNTLWKDTDGVTHFIDEDGYIARQQTEVRVMYDSQRVYFSVKCEEENMEVLMKDSIFPSRKDCWCKDHINIFLDASHCHEHYFHFMVNEKGELFDRKKNNFGWDAEGLDYSVERKEKYWTAFLSIPYATLGVDAPEEGRVWGVNFSRQESPSCDGISWWIECKDEPEGFGHLIFGQPAVNRADFIDGHLNEEISNGSGGNLRILTVNADRFEGENSVVKTAEPLARQRYGLKVQPVRNGYGLKVYKEWISLPAQGQIRAFFLLNEDPKDNNIEKSYFFLNLYPLRLFPYLVKDKEESQLSHTVKVNGRAVNNIRKEGGYSNYEAIFLIPIPTFCLRQGINELVIERVNPILYPTSDRVEYFSILERKVKNLEITRTPRYVNAGDDFYIKIEILMPNCLKKIICPPAVEPLEKLPVKLDAGTHRLRFRALMPLAKPEIVMKFERGETTCIFERIVDVPENGIKYMMFTMVSSNPDCLEAHEMEIEALRDMDIGNSVHQRTPFSKDITPDFSRKVMECYVKNRMYITFSWFAIAGRNRDPKDGWMNAQESQVPAVNENDLKGRAGKYLFYGGSARIEPEDGKWENVQQVKDAYIRRLKSFYEMNPTFACHINEMWHRYACEAGSRFPWVQLNYSNSEMILSSMRGTSRAYGETGFGVSGCDDNAVAVTSDIRYLRMSAIHNWVAYISGATAFLPEISHTWAWHGRYLPSRRLLSDYFENEIDRNRMLIEKDFYDYIRTHTRGQGPLTPLGFVQGNLDGWHGWDGYDGDAGYQEGRYLPGQYLWSPSYQYDDIVEGKFPKWQFGAPEAGWRHLGIVFSGAKFIMTYPILYPTKRQFWLSGTPYGKVDILPDEAPLNALRRYRALIFLGWNTATDKQYEKLKAYVENGGTLFMAVPQLSTHIRRDSDLELLRGGNFKDLFGVEIKGRGEQINSLKFMDNFPQSDIQFPSGKCYEMAGHAKNQIYISSLNNFTANPIAVVTCDSKPVFVENRIGKGHAFLLALWNYPGEEKLTSFIHDVIKSITSGVQNAVRVSGNDNVNFAVYLDKEGKEGDVVTRIFMVDIDWWTLEREISSCTLHLNGRAFPLTLPPADIKKVVYYKEIAITTAGKTVHVEDIKEIKGSYQIILQGGGLEKFQVFLLSGRPGEITLNGNTVKYQYDQTSNIILFGLNLSGRDTLFIKVTQCLKTSEITL